MANRRGNEPRAATFGLLESNPEESRPGAERHAPLYDAIELLDGATDVKDLAARLKPILNQLAFYLVTGEGAVMDSHEEWHEEFRDQLYNDANSDFKAATSKMRGPRPPPARGQDPLPSGRVGGKRAPVAPPTRPLPEELPDSLRRLLGEKPSKGSKRRTSTISRRAGARSASRCCATSRRRLAEHRSRPQPHGSVFARRSRACPARNPRTRRTSRSC